MTRDIFSDKIKGNFWLVRAGDGKEAVFLSDCIPDAGKGILVFRTSKAAEQTAKEMNAIRQRMKMPQIYFAVKGTQEDISGCAIILQ